MSTETLEIIHVLLEGGVLVVAIRGLVGLGKVLQRIEDHDRRIDRLEERVFDE